VINDPAVRRVAVALIRSLNAPVIREGDSDDDLLSRFGSAAEPIAEALVDVIRQEVREVG
jgi:hypothetical protein